MMVAIPYYAPPPVKLRKGMPRFQFTYNDIAPPLEFIDAPKATPQLTWRLTFEKQQMADFVSMTNGLDPAMRLGIPIEINLPSLRRTKSLLQVFKSREANDPYNPQRRVVLNVHLPTELETVYTNKQTPSVKPEISTTFDGFAPRKSEILVRPALDELIRTYFLRNTLVSATQSTSALGLRPITEQIQLCTIFFQPYVNIRAKLEFITNNRGVWIEVSRWSCPSRLAQELHVNSGSSNESCLAWAVLAVLPTPVYAAISCDPQVSQLNNEPSISMQNGGWE